MRTSGPQVIRPKLVEGKAEAPQPTVVMVHHKGNALAVATTGPSGTRLELFAGATPRDRELAALDDYLRASADAPSDDDFSAMLDRIPSYSGGMTPAVARLAQECVESYRRPHARSRGDDTRAQCFHRLAVSLNLIGDEMTPQRLRETLRRARRRLPPSR